MQLTKTNIDMKGLSSYTSNNRFHFEYVQNNVHVEGDIVLGSGQRDGESYAYVSHIEITNNVQLSDDKIEEIESALENNFVQYITNAEKI